MNIAVKVECGAGGSPKMVIEKAVRLRGSRSYDKCYVLVDADLSITLNAELKKRIRKKPPIEILKATPCIEGLFLKILNHPNFSQKKVSSDICKRIFKARYNFKGKKTNKHSYENIFTKKIFLIRRKEVQELENILNAMGMYKK